jgi:hypothetical protein
METKYRDRISLFLLSMVLMYISIQLHEAFHWIIAVMAGIHINFVECQSVSAGAGEWWKALAMSFGGPLNTILYVIAGLLMFRSENTTIKRLGFLLVFLNGFGRIGYDLSGVVAGTGVDELSIAEKLGIHSAFLRIPLTLSCAAAALYVTLKDRKAGPGRTGWIIPACAMPPAFALILLFSAMLKILMKTGGVFFTPSLLGYTPFLIIVNAGQCILLFCLIHRRFSLRSGVLLAAGIFNLALAGSAAAVIIVKNPCASAPKVIEITPSGGELEAVRRNGSAVVIRFDRAMDPVIPSFARDISYRPEKGALEATAAWSAPDTLVCRFSREVFPGEVLGLRIKGLKDAAGNEMCASIDLDFR